MSQIGELLAQWRAMDVITWSEHKYGWITEQDRPIVLADWQRAVLGEYLQKQDITTFLICSVKKSGKTLVNSLVLAYRWLTIEHPNLHFAVGNDRDQSAELQVSMIAAMVKRHPILSKFTKVTKNELTFEPTGARIVALPMDWAGSGGGNFSTVSFSELWAYTYESGRRLFEELTPIPNLDPPCLRIVDSYAGFEAESELLAEVWKRGKGGESGTPDWPIYLVGQQLSYIHQGEDAQVRCWRGDPAKREAYYEEQRATLRESTYRRLHLNEWVSSEDAFVTGAQWDALVLAGYRCPEPGARLGLTVGLDVAVKRDYCAAVSVYSKDGLTHLGPYRIFKPRPVVDLDAVEAYLLELSNGYSVLRVVYDPYQAAFLAQRLQKRGLRMEEYPQTLPNLTLCGNTLFDVIRQGQLAVYEGADDLRGHVLNARARETDRGIRLVKSGGGKIDACISLAMAIQSQRSKGAAGCWQGGSWRSTD